MMHAMVGHEGAREALARARLRGTLPAALLLMGPRGIGKQRLALWTAQAILCREAGAQGGCGSCRDCRRVLRLEHPDLHWFFPVPRPKNTSPEKLPEALEEARLQRLAEIRENPVRGSWSEEAEAIYLAVAQELRRRARSRPAENGEQVFIIGDADRLVPQESSQEAANALLKLLEEPPSDTRFILTSSEPGRVLATIRSRTVPLHLAPLAGDATAAFLVETRGSAAEDAERSARLAGGSIGLALGYLDDDDGNPGPLEDRRRLAFSILRAAIEGRPGAAYALVLDPANLKNPALKQGRLLAPVLDDLDVWLRDLATVAADTADEAVNQDGVPYMRKSAAALGLHPAAVAEAVGEVEVARREALGNGMPSLVLPGLVARLRRALLDSPISPATKVP